MAQHESRRDRKEEIFEAALQCFNENGYYEASIDSIAERAKISKGGIYYHFDSKKALFLELFHYRVHKFFNQLKVYIQKESDPEKRLRMFITRASQILKTNSDFFKFCIEFLSMGVRDADIRQEMTDFYGEAVGTFYELLKEGQEQGTFNPMDPHKVARAIYFLFMGVFFTYFSVNVDFDLIEQHSFQIDNILGAIKKR